MSDYKYIVVDCETTGLSWIDDRMHGLGVGYSLEDIQYYLASEIPESVKKDLENPKIAKIGHNLHNFDAKFIKQLGINIKGPFDDTMILANLIDDNQPLGLKGLTEKYIGEGNLDNKHTLDRYITEQKAGTIAGLCAQDLLSPEHPHFQIIAEYCKEDVKNTLELFLIFRDRLKEMDKNLKERFGFKKSPLDYYLEEARPLEYILFEIEYRGIRIDMAQIDRVKNAAVDRMNYIEQRLSKILVQRIPFVEQELYRQICAKDKTKSKTAAVRNKPGEGKCKFAWSNNNHVGLLFYRFCDLPANLIKRTSKGKLQTDKEALQKLLAEFAPTDVFYKILKLFIEYKTHAKIVSTYTGSDKKGIVSKIRTVNGIPRIFPQYRQTTGTGRLACSSPNMQNIKRDSEIKKFFIPDSEDEVFDDADYSQIELRTGAHVSQDAGLCDAYRNNEDVHIRTASRLFGRQISKADDLERQAGKRTNFLTIFDGKAPRLQAALKADTGKEFSVQQCKEFIRVWFDTYPGVRMYLDSQLEFFKQYKFCISETGKVRWLPDIVFGKHIEWVFNKDLHQHEPIYQGPKAQELIEEVIKANPNLKGKEVPQGMIGWQAWRRYSHAVKSGYNNPIQGLAASMTKRAMIALHRAGRKIANQVHDSLVVSRNKEDLQAKQQVIDIMEKTYGLTVPVLVDIKTLRSFHPSDKIEE